MSDKPFRIAVAGAHSTGKTTFLTELKDILQRDGLKVAYIHESAGKAKEKGFPILANHTFESTAWLIARTIEMETEASLFFDVVLVDRPVADALGYLYAALRHTNRIISSDRIAALESICEAWSKEYDLVFLTKLEDSVGLGEGRDRDEVFRRLAADEVRRIIDKLVPSRHLLKFGHMEEAVSFALDCFDNHRKP
ncbi:hypothetical protein DU478_05470 [Thalassococcus profundi]|uniref:NadR/Ttd14 AAA domain-containing protein n=1 Tax=Thalassococcus profundi TaxID=2282382 RepID=A0A369TST0_9RHOB|nr:AAA family ATPase [Thalassococcus profundi]RDD67187.1 hypothetical protein DU478_05470 [Thalassococcus profundi]